MAKDFLLRRDYFGNLVVAFNAIYPIIAETVEPNKIPNRERALMLSPASALKARLAKNIDMVKPIPHKNRYGKNLFEVDALRKFCYA